jgi:hypothetical protein
MAGSNPIELYPNPNQGQFVLRSQSLPGGKYDLTIFDVRGKPVYTEKAIIIENDFLHSLNLGNLSNGVYMVQIRNTNTSGFNKRFVISK